MAEPTRGDKDQTAKVTEREAPVVDDALIGGVAVHWRDEEGLEKLLEAWPPAYPLVVVDNSRTLSSEALHSEIGSQTLDLRVVEPEVNLGFGGGVNRGLGELRYRHPACRFLLILNPDAAPEKGAIERLLEAGLHHSQDPSCAGVAPALLHADGSTQHRWQLQPLPSASALIAQVFFLGGARGPGIEPAAGAPIEQPAAAVLALDLERIDAGDLFDPGFYPAWFDDVDLAKRLQARGLTFRYAPSSRFFHAQGASVPALGYGRFLWIYYRNLIRYLGKHHGRGWKVLALALVPFSMLARLVLLPLRRPSRAHGRLDAARGLIGVAVGALSGWRAPRAWASLFEAPDFGDPDISGPVEADHV